MWGLYSRIKDLEKENAELKRRIQCRDRLHQRLDKRPETCDNGSSISKLPHAQGG